MVTGVERAKDGFLVRLAGGEQLEASRVVVATGLAPFATRPPLFGSLPPSLVSHSSDYVDFDSLAGKRVVVIGAGQSALESAALLGERGAAVEVLARTSAIKWLPDNTQPPTAQSWTRVAIPLPPTGVGGRVTGWMAAAPDALRRTPGQLQRWVAEQCIAPAGSGWLRPRLTEVKISSGRFTTRAEARDGEVLLLLNDGSERIVDHVLLGTGYEIDVSRYSFLTPQLAGQIETIRGYPRLGPGLESSVAGLHFVGAPAAMSFGPAMRFVVGTWYAAPAVTLRVLGRRQPPIRFAS
jgi:cation diffusion facilitator CzcD-associated flavoprotein CzcO